jgi:hypothetical protein
LNDDRYLAAGVTVDTHDEQHGRIADGNGSSTPGDGGWPVAVLKSVVILVLSLGLLVLVPNRLLGYLATRVGPNVRDGIVTASVAVFFVALAWAFTALQGPRRG